MREITQAMKNHPRCVGPLHSKLMSLDLPMSSLHIPDPAAVLSRQAQHNQRLQTRGSSSASLGAGSEEGAEAGDAKAWPKVPQRARVLADLSQSLVRDWLLAQLQPTLLSSKNLKSVTSGDLSGPFGPFRLLEFLTGVEPEKFDLTSDLRDMKLVYETMRGRMALRMDRILPLAQSLDLDWQSIGLVRLLTQTDTSVEMVHAYTDEQISLSLTAPLPAEAEIVNNWSEKHVAVRCGVYMQEVGSMFRHYRGASNGDVATPEPEGGKKRAKLQPLTPPKALPAPPPTLALPSSTPMTPEPKPADEIHLVAGSPGSIISD